jgi:hypothetical protein
MPYVKQERRSALDEVVSELEKVEFSNINLSNFLILLCQQSASKAAPSVRPALKKAIKADVEPNGDINYIIFKYCKYNIEPSYNNYKNFIGIIYSVIDLMIAHSRSEYTKYIDEYREAAEWIRIKLLTPYEEEKIIENGDV